MLLSVNLKLKKLSKSKKIACGAQKLVQQFFSCRTPWAVGDILESERSQISAFGVLKDRKLEKSRKNLENVGFCDGLQRRSRKKTGSQMSKNSTAALLLAIS